MVSIGKRILTGLVGAAITTSISAGFGACCGYIYAKLADLPVEQAVKVGAVCVVAHGAIMHLANVAIENRIAKAFVITSISILSTTFGIHELKKRGLMNDKVMIFYVAAQALNFLSIISAVALNPTTQEESVI